MSPLLLAGAALLTAAVGALGGLGGAVLLVPALVVGGLPAAEAAPLGLLSVAAGSVAAGALQLAERTVNHRLGVTTEVAASAGAAMGALASGAVGEELLTRALGVVAVAAAVLGVRRKGLRNPPDPAAGGELVGEWPGQLAGAYRLPEGVVTYRARRLPAGLALMWVSGVVAGVAGTSGGFIKTPVTSEVMTVPVKVAASTTTFTIGVTSAAGLAVFAAQGRIDPVAGAAVVAGSLLGGRLGARLQAGVPPQLVRRALAGVLLVVGVLLWVT